jgi:hypothetical protein
VLKIPEEEWHGSFFQSQCAGTSLDGGIGRQSGFVVWGEQRTGAVCRCLAQ